MLFAFNEKIPRLMRLEPGGKTGDLEIVELDQLVKNNVVLYILYLQRLR